MRAIPSPLVLFCLQVNAPAKHARTCKESVGDETVGNNLHLTSRPTPTPIPIPSLPFCSACPAALGSCERASQLSETGEEEEEEEEDDDDDNEGKPLWILIKFG